MNNAFNIDWSWWQVAGLLLVGCAASFVFGRLTGGRRGLSETVMDDLREETAPDLESALASPGEKRRAVRRRGNPVDVLVSGEGYGPTAGKVVDRSLGGLCLLLAQPVSLGAILQVRSCYAPEDVPGVRVEVRFCRQSRDIWEVGCQFLGTPDWSELLLFG